MTVLEQAAAVRTRVSGTGSRLDTRWALLVVAVGTFLLRMPFIAFPMTSDEGGYLQLVRQWSQGSSDYGDYFMDRPPVLVVWYQLIELLSGPLGTMGAVRTVGSLAAAVTVLGVGLAGRELGGRRGGLVGAVTAGALLCSPFMGGVASDGELLAAPFIALGIWLALAAVRAPGTEHSRRAAILAGVAGGLAWMVKQNMLDVAVFAGVLALAMWRTRRITFAQVRGLAVPFLGGATAAVLVVLGYAAIFGTSPRELLYAMYGFRAQAAGELVQFTAAERWGRLQDLVVRGMLSGGLLVPVLLGLALRRRFTGERSRRSPVEVAVLVLCVFVTVSVAAGGAFWQHYTVQYIVPIGLVAALLVEALPRAGRMLIAPCIAVCVLGWVLGAFWPPHSQSVSIGKAVGQVSAPGDTMVSALGDPVITESAGLTSPYYQLWSLSARTMDPHFTQLRDVLSGPAAPTWVVVRGPETLATLNSSAPGTVLASRYHQVATMCDRIVYLRDGVARETPKVPGICERYAERGPDRVLVNDGH